MKIIIITLFFSNFLFSQTAVLNGKVFEEDSKVGFPFVQLILKDEKEKSFILQTDLEGNFKFENLIFGVYSLKISFIGLRDNFIEKLIINKDQNELNIKFPEKCIKKNKICPNNHYDNIIPIIYGFPSKKLLNKSKKGKVKLGGCDPSFCEKWYCKKHNLSF